MKISVIIPCLNGASTLAEQLDALTRQKSKPWEVLVVDNGSTDNSKAIAIRYQNRLLNFRIVDATARRGSAYARNEGAKTATGDVLLWCDADNVVDSGWIKAMQNAFTHYDFVSSRLDYKLLNSPNAQGVQENGLMNFKPPWLDHAASCGIGIKRSIHESIGGFDENMMLGDDTEYCVRVQLAGVKLHFIQEAVIDYRYRTNLKSAIRQGFNWGDGYALLYKRYRLRGMPRQGFLL
jgi:glycosyltransferase involved in cell wall biosynthesis